MIAAFAAARRIPAEVLDATVTGINLMPGTLRDQLGPGDTTPLLFFFQGGTTELRRGSATRRAARRRDLGAHPARRNALRSRR
ncbi:MAG: hypothetical protein M5U32_11100 [Myxococcota bacterium]|nr:hypothetical protein [Myxococcota bacterium]